MRCVYFEIFVLRQYSLFLLCWEGRRICVDNDEGQWQTKLESQPHSVRFLS